MNTSWTSALVNKILLYWDLRESPSELVGDDGPQAFPAVERLDGLDGALDTFEPVGNVMVEIQPSSLVVVDQRRHLRPALEAPKSRPGPLPAGDKLERPS